MTTKKQNQEILKVLEGRIDKIKVQKILRDLQSLPKDEICGKDGNLDLKKFHTRQETKDAIKKLKQLGVTRKYLQKHFIIASLTIGGLL